jgi:hypothetical protein
MINHARTLLMNVDGAHRPAPDSFLEEYIPPDFDAQELPSHMESLHKVMFGNDPDNAFRNFRAWQLMKVLHSTEFADYVTDLDPRITYLHDRSVIDAVQAATFEALNASATNELFEIGSVEADPTVPLMQPSWTLEVLAALYVRTTALRSGLTQDSVVTISDELTSIIPMAGQANYGVRIRATASLPVGARWRITKLVFPDADLSQLLADLEAHEAALSRLFGVTEPYKTFGELWNRHAILSYRLSGALLAFIHRAEEARTGNG